MLLADDHCGVDSAETLTVCLYHKSGTNAHTRRLCRYPRELAGRGCRQWAGGINVKVQSEISARVQIKIYFRDVGYCSVLRVGRGCRHGVVGGVIRTPVRTGGGWLATSSHVDLLLVGLGRCQTSPGVSFWRRIWLWNLVDGLGRIGHAVHGSCSVDRLRRRQRGLLGVLVGMLWALVGILGLVRVG